MLNRLILLTAILAAFVVGNAVAASLIHDTVIVRNVPVFVPSKPAHHAEHIEPGAFTVLANAVKPARMK